jgi:hypothetical protein
LTVPDSKKERRSGLTESDSAVRRLVDQAGQRQRESLSDGRGRAGRSGQKGVDSAGRSKATYNVTRPRQDLVREMAGAEDVSQSDIVEAAIVAFYNAWAGGKVDLAGLKKPARSLKATWKIAVPDEFELSEE